MSEAKEKRGRVSWRELLDRRSLPEAKGPARNRVLSAARVRLAQDTMTREARNSAGRPWFRSVLTPAWVAATILVVAGVVAVALVRDSGDRGVGGKGAAAVATPKVAAVPAGAELSAISDRLARLEHDVAALRGPTRRASLRSGTDLRELRKRAESLRRSLDGLPKGGGAL